MWALHGLMWDYYASVGVCIRHDVGSSDISFVISSYYRMDGWRVYSVEYSDSNLTNGLKKKLVYIRSQCSWKYILCLSYD